MYTASTAFLEALAEAGVDYLFCNFGSDHPAMIEALAEAARRGRRLPKVITCPNEMVALTAAQGHAQVSGRPQAVIVHVECGTQSLAGAVHNVSKGRVPVLIFAGPRPSPSSASFPAAATNSSSGSRTSTTRGASSAATCATMPSCARAGTSSR